MALLEVKDLSVRYEVRTPWFKKQRYLYAVNHVSFTLDKGETIGLVGESGCGKSTLGKALVRLENPCAGEILLNGQDLARAKGKKLREMRKHFQMIFQDPYSSLNPRLSIFASLDEVIAMHCRMPVEKRREKAAGLLEMVGLTPEALHRFPHQFSGGQRQRIGIARALAADPDFIVADEPVSALDVSVQASIVNLLQDIQQRSRTALLFIAHDLAVVEHISARILVMYLGHIVESAPAKALVSSPRHPYTEALLSAVPTTAGKLTDRIRLAGDVPSPLNPPPGCPFHERCLYATARCRVEKPPVTVNGDRSFSCWNPR
ncbi:MAG: ATP-binding cassette domain-containing protein [Lentisphaeria bacterium]|nr:ATP-binding cassette domain-containing protein [Lentisphaeria bacterium]